ncbi:hypothetical protein A4H34_08815 [Peptidiphaga gingivicola]|uniref:Uncharacterized protein n=1 Tax=Peptidiphaga gingivicola TaxID=2741497 RepID=A0A179B1T0_9ACTO|nr:hypothetical protein A4H34_08815 [Peptidiphaga gingivicola]
MCVSKEFYALCLAANVGPAPTASWKPLRPWKSLRRRLPPAFCAMPMASRFLRNADGLPLSAQCRRPPNGFFLAAAFRFCLAFRFRLAAAPKPAGGTRV